MSESSKTSESSKSSKLSKSSKSSKSNKSNESNKWSKTSKTKETENQTCPCKLALKSYLDGIPTLDNSIFIISRLILDFSVAKVSNIYLFRPPPTGEETIKDMSRISRVLF